MPDLSGHRFCRPAIRCDPRRETNHDVLSNKKRLSYDESHKALWPGPMSETSFTINEVNCAFPDPVLAAVVGLRRVSTK